MVVALYTTINYLTIGRNLYAVEALPEKKYICLQAHNKYDCPQVNCNGDVLASRQGTSSTIDDRAYAYGKASIGCVWTDYTNKVGHILVKVYSIILYNRELT